MTVVPSLELVCPAGSLPALMAAVDNGADGVYLGFKDATNARNFAGLNFDEAAVREGIRYAHARDVEVLVAINTYPQPAAWDQWTRAVDRAVLLGADAVLLADLGLIEYTRDRHPKLPIHLSVQASATSYRAINFYGTRFGVRRAVLPRVLSLAQVENVVRHTDVEIEVFGFGSLCVMVEGRCALSSYVTGESPNTAGVCSPASAVRWRQQGDRLEVSLGGVLIDRLGAEERAGYPTVCKGRYRVEGFCYYALEEPVSLNTLELLPALMRIGVRAIKLEGRQRSPAYVASITRVWREAIDACMRDPDRFVPQAQWMAQLGEVSEGSQCTLGAFDRPWK
jgi:putative protease